MTLALATATEQTLEQLVDELIAAKAVETKPTTIASRSKRN